MSRLTAAKLKGIWAGVTMTWDEKFRFDEKTYAENIKRTIAAGVHGIYTTGSTGEFYAIEYDEFCRMVDIQADLCGKAGMPLQIGCCSDATAKTIKLLKYAASRPEVGAVQINVPYWMELEDKDLIGFFKDINKACPDMPIVHYNIPRAKRFLGGSDYLRILEVAPNLIGVKFTFAGTNFAKLQDALIKLPKLAFYVGESLLVSAMQLGAAGCCSSLVATNPEWTLDMYAKAANGQWDEAIKKQKRAATFFDDAEAFITERGEGTSDPVFDKGLSVASGCLLGHQRCRAPYAGWSDETIKDLRIWMKENYPEFIYQSR
jgi:dihydrodipicolinate synthase/N-acetylneuraminate lyase